jgi:hypothetical protein
MTSAPFHGLTARITRSDGALQLQRSRALLVAYRSRGGSVHAHDLPTLLGTTISSGAPQMTRWLLSGELVSFRMGACLHVPLFQFCWVRPGLCPDVSRVVEALRARLDGTEVAEWFVCPNPWLEWRLPVAVLGGEYGRVLLAARAENTG